MNEQEIREALIQRFVELSDRTKEMYDLWQLMVKNNNPDSEQFFQDFLEANAMETWAWEMLKVYRSHIERMVGNESR
jgi:hypothetical protein